MQHTPISPPMTDTLAYLNRFKLHERLYAQVSKLHTRARCVCVLSIQRLEVPIWEVMVAGCAPQLGSVQITEYPTVALFEKHMNSEH